MDYTLTRVTVDRHHLPKRVSATHFSFWVLTANARGLTRIASPNARAALPAQRSNRARCRAKVERLEPPEAPECSRVPHALQDFALGRKGVPGTTLFAAKARPRRARRPPPHLRTARRIRRPAGASRSPSRKTRWLSHPPSCICRRSSLTCGSLGVNLAARSTSSLALVRCPSWMCE